MTSSPSLWGLTCIHRKPALGARCLQVFSMGAHLEDGCHPALHFQEMILRFLVALTLKERHLDDSWKGKSIWNKAEWKESNIHNSLSFSVAGHLPPHVHWLWNSLWTASRWQNTQSLSHQPIHSQAPLYSQNSLNSSALGMPGNMGGFKTNVYLQTCPHYQLQSYSVFPAEFLFIAAFRIMPSVNTF